MPRVTRHKSQGRATKRGKMDCCRCDKPIVKGEEYFQWKIKMQHGGILKRQHVAHGHPRASQLTTSKIGEAYAAVEGADDALLIAGTPQDVRDALQECHDAIEAVRDEYQSSLENMPESLQEGPTGQQITERIEQLEEFMTELENGISDVEDFEADEDFDDKDRDDQGDAEDHLQEQVSNAQTVLDQVSF